MSHPFVFAGHRGSNTGSGGAVQANETSTMLPHMVPAGFSSPGPHHPPHSLSIHPQVQSVVAQVKKKSGFQITSVLPAQLSASANNSIADDTESYDDMDESHTDDLSSSDILDVSVSRATDTGFPERSSSEETLNSLHGGETSGVVSPNEPIIHQPQQECMVNGVHHHHNNHQPYRHHKGAQGRPAVAPAATITLPGPATHGEVTGGKSVPATLMEGSGSAAVNHPTAVLTGRVGAEADSGCATGLAGNVSNAATVTPSHPLPVFTAVTAAACTVSRFRVVKLDSNSEPFRKGRWTCTEYYEKHAPPGDTAAAHRTVENIIPLEHETTSDSFSESTLSRREDVPQTYGRQTDRSMEYGIYGILSLPWLAKGGVTGLAGQTAADACFAPGQEASADEDSSSGAGVVAIDNKIEQAMDLVKSHLMYAVREEVEVLKEQIKELNERNSQLEQENTFLKNLASPEQLAQFQARSPAPIPHAGALGAPAALLQSLSSNQGPGPTA